MALGPSSLVHHGRAAPGAWDLSPEASPLKPQLLTQIPELMVRLLVVSQGLVWAVVIVTLEKLTSFPLVSEFLRQNWQARVIRIPPTQVEAQACGSQRR